MTTTDTDLGDTARLALVNDAEDDGFNDATGELLPEPTKVKFVGMSTEDTENVWKLGDIVAFVVVGRVVGESEEEMADGHHRSTLKVRVSQVVPHALNG